MENIVSDDEADIAIAAGLRKERTAGWLAAKVGKTVAEIQPALVTSCTTACSAVCTAKSWARIHISCRYLHPAYSK